MTISAFIGRVNGFAQVLAGLPLEQIFLLYRARSKKADKAPPEAILIQTTPSTSQPSARPKHPSKNGGLAPLSGISLPTTEETVLHLKRQLAKELYRFELDLAGGCKIAGKACDCCEKHPMLGLEAMCEELIPMDPRNPVYREIPKWIKTYQEKLTTEASASGKYDDEYPLMAFAVRDFRKQVMGTESMGAMLTEDEKVKVKARAAKMIESSMEA